MMQLQPHRLRIRTRWPLLAKIEETRHARAPLSSESGIAECVRWSFTSLLPLRFELPPSMRVCARVYWREWMLKQAGIKV
ncbi:hypothetical protein K1719_032772 [Acacia pycnantha]|nr:hypothetical protein K1719_032772 [Acacia pycnantha]